MKKRYWITFIVTTLVGIALHFLYDLWPNPLFAIIAPINESVWEHLKLLFWPFLAAGWTLYAADRRMSMLGAVMAAQLLMPVLLLGVYYTLLAGFSLSADVINILLYVIVLAVGFWFVYTHRNSGKLARAAGVLTMLVAVYATCLLVFTIAAPDLPIFREN